MAGTLRTSGSELKSSQAVEYSVSAFGLTTLVVVVVHMLVEVRRSERRWQGDDSGPHHLTGEENLQGINGIFPTQMIPASAHFLRQY